MKFSQRIGKTAIRKELQIESMDDELCKRLWNAFLSHFDGELARLDYEERNYGREGPSQGVLILLWTDFFVEKADEIPCSQGKVSHDSIIDYTKNYFFSTEWYLRYDFIEYLLPIDQHFELGFTEECIRILKNQLSGYSIINNEVVPISSEEEIATIEEAINSEIKDPIREHLTSALNHLSNRKNPDYRNSIKESISAVEGFCVYLTNNPKATLGDTLKIIESKYSLHGALKRAFSSLYGYSSDSGGIRHSLIENDTRVTVDEAKFMLVSCSAFINYLRSKISETGLA